jgi:hypothetical protein
MVGADAAVTRLVVMLGNFVDQQSIWRFTSEHPRNQIADSRRLVPGPRAPVTRQSLDHGAGHQHLDLIVADPQPQPRVNSA